MGKAVMICTLSLKIYFQMTSEETSLKITNQIKLKDLQDDLGYSNYQALVQAKYNCKKRLVQKVYEVLNNLKKQ